MFRFSASSDANSVIKTIQKRNISNADNFISLYATAKKIAVILLYGIVVVARL